MLEVNPRASRTVPFIAKAVGVPLVGDGGAADGGQDARGDRASPRSRAVPARLRQGAGLPVQPLPRRRSGARPGDEVDRRGDGDRARLRRGLRQGLARRRPPAAARGHRVPLGARPRQAGRCCRWRAGSPSSASTWSRPPAPPSYLRGAAARRCAPVLQGPRGPPARRRPPDQRRDRPGRQHAARPRVARGRRAHPPHGAAATTSPASPRSRARLAAVEGIAAQRAQPGFDVRSLQSLEAPGDLGATADSTTLRAS